MSVAEAKVSPPARRMGSADAAFLYLERKEIPLHIASVAVFDGVIPYEEFVAAIDSKLHLVPRYRQVPVVPPLNIGYPTWEPDPQFDIRRHILRARVDGPGGEAELEELAGRLLSQLMDRHKPLWEIHVVEGLANGRGALVVKVHHSLADGISGAALLKIMLDPTPEGSCAIKKPRLEPAERPTPDDPLSALGSVVQGTLENLLAAEAGILQFAQALFTGGMQQSLLGVAGLVPELAASVERLPFNKPCGAERRFCWTDVDFADVQAIRAAAGCGTINDVVLTVVTRAVASYARLHGETVANRYLRVVCPVSLRRDAGESLGNRISFLPVALPMDVKNPVEMLRMVAARTEIMKNARAADLVALLGSALGMTPPPVQAAIWQVLPYVTFPLPILNMICTNVPGSPTPLYAAGRRMIASYPQVPTGYELGVGCAVQSYAGKLCFGLLSDAQAAPDAKRLRDFIQVHFKELCRAAGLKRAARAKPARAQRQQAAGSVTGQEGPAKPAARPKRAARAASMAAPDIETLVNPAEQQPASLTRPASADAPAAVAAKRFKAAAKPVPAAAPDAQAPEPAEERQRVPGQEGPEAPLVKSTVA